MELNRGLLLLAEMSSKGTLATGDYALKTIEMAKNHYEFVIGFIGQSRLDTSRDWLILTPGIKLQVNNIDNLGQQYKTPETAILKDNCDVIIVGRGIYQNANDGEITKNAIKYQKEGWNSYLKRINQK
jgi:orotidine-5'-phosphate decarboxylase